MISSRICVNINLSKSLYHCTTKGWFMKSLWNEDEARALGGDPLAQRVYTSRLMGQEPDLVLHGGGNTSVKAEVVNVFGETEQVCYIKGSGWDLATIEADGFAPVRLDVLLKMAELEHMTDTDMVRNQRAAMLNPDAPAPSVEAILHAIIPLKFVDHTHADAVVTITNTHGGEERIRELYGDRVLVVPYVMPGFILARRVYEMAREVDWQSLEGMILLNHGVFTFHDDARASYERMITLVTEAEQYLEKHGARQIASGSPEAATDAMDVARLRRSVSAARGGAVVVRMNTGEVAAGFASLADVAAIATRGPLTPNHVVRTKRTPLIIGDDADKSVADYTAQYQQYFDANTDGDLTCLDPAPRWCVWPGQGVVCFGRTSKEAGIIADIADHTVRAIQAAEALGGWTALPEQDVFDVEYWELEQAKHARGGPPPPLQGKIALITGGASGIGQACARQLHDEGAVVAVLDINPEVERIFEADGRFGQVCDLTDADAVGQAIDRIVRRFGGLDILVSNAGTFPKSRKIAETDADHWNRSLAVNLSSHQFVLRACVPFLELGVGPAVVIIGSKNVPAPGPGASAYSAAKAGLTQLARTAALELGPSGVRVNVIHPNDVFDTGIWTDQVLGSRAAHYGMTVDEYKRRNLLGVDITSDDVALMVVSMVGPVFARTTGAQVAVDGGNDRVI